MLVKDWMTPNPKTISSKTPVMEAMQYLREKSFRRLPVIERDKVVGMITERDLKEATPSSATTLSIYELNYLLSKLSVADVMVKNVISIEANKPLEEAALLMEEKKISGLPVLEHNKLVGVLTITDVLKAFVSVLGLREGGVRVSVDLPDKPGVLAHVTEAAAPSNIVAAVTAGIKQGELRNVVLRVTGEDAKGFPERLRAKGIEVQGVHES